LRLKVEVRRDVMKTESDTVYQCDVCGEEFESEAARKQHVREAGLVI
jgi:hypothetical protein